MMAAYRSIAQILVFAAFCLVPFGAKPIVDPGLFVIQGVTSCINGTGYCMLGSNCSVDVDFLADSDGGHCKGLRDAFTPKIDFVCCRYNPLGRATSKPPTTTINSYTITDVFSLIDNQVALQQENEDEIPDDFNPENFIDIVGVVTDFTGIVGLVTRPWTGTFPTKATSPTTTPMTTSPSTTTAAPASPATPVDVENAIVNIKQEESTSETTVETTESYNEVPTDTTEQPVSSEQDSETSQQAHETTTIGSTTKSSDSSGEEQDIEIVNVKNNNGTSTTAATPASSSSDVATTTTTTTSEKPIGDNIIYLDNALVSQLPILETEPLEAETESIINIVGETVDSNSVQGIPGPGSTTDKVNKVPHSDADPSAQEQQVSEGPLSPDQEHIGIYPVKPNDDYDYYSEYPDQHLLQPVNKNICGFKGFKNYINAESSSRILGGVVASTVEWCWVAAIMERRQSGDKYICTGALVESDLVLTTATCLRRLVSRDLSSFIVVLGDSNLREDLPYGIQFHRITEVVMHPDYLTSGGAHANDVGVLRLRDHATVSDNVCLVCLTQQDAIFPSQSCTVTGYGIGDVPKNMIKDVRDTVPIDGILRQISVPILETPKCQKSLHNMTGSEILAHSDSFLCAGGLDGKNACYSTMDGGSPLACEAGGRWFLAGIVSWTRDCENQDVPNVYTRVSSFSNWLQATHLRMMGFVTHQIRLA